jgi:hypothetical protein
VALACSAVALFVFLYAIGGLDPYLSEGYQSLHLWGRLPGSGTGFEFFQETPGETPGETPRGTAGTGVDGTHGVEMRSRSKAGDSSKDTDEKFHSTEGDTV